MNDKDGKNIFQDPRDKYGLSQEAYYFLGGIFKHIKAMTLILNPIVNSYKRLIPGFEAPTYIAWSAKNRTPLVRIPGTRGEDTRIELRYLALAVCLHAGLDGIKNQILPPECMDANMNAMTLEELEANGVEILPRDLGEAIQEFEADPLMKEALGEEMCAKIADAKKKEWEEYNAQVSQWEIDSYLLRV